MIRIAIIGATGYTGSELVRILLHHPDADIKMITSETHTGKPFSSIHPQFLGICDQILSSADDLDEEMIDLVFLALPHRISMEYVKRWQHMSFKIIDLSGDYRLSSAAVYEEWYKTVHHTPGLLPDVPYGLPELHRKDLIKAKIIANPGCYPTATALALAPLIASNNIESNSIIVDAKSGVTGAGVKSTSTTHFSNVQDNFMAYALKNHRHTIEIEETLSNLKSKNLQSTNSESKNVIVQFTPHLLPVDRGILVTCYATPSLSITEKSVQELYETFYRDESFVRVRSTPPQIKQVRGTNLCDVYATYDERTNRIITMSAIDNLVKGAAGQAVQNMNIAFGLTETVGLQHIPLQP